MAENPLGKTTAIPDKYAPEVLYPIPRWPSRSLLDIDKKLLMFGFDCWRAYELSWLDKAGRPQTAIGELYFDARSENMVESKSLKLYLNSLINERFPDTAKLKEVITRDLSKVSKSAVVFEFNSLFALDEAVINEPDGMVIDDLPLTVEDNLPNATLLQTEEVTVHQDTLISHAFRSNCPITGQPDWASCVVTYSGRRIDPASLLQYICSFKGHQGYHEECAEIIFRDIMLQCQPDELLVALNYTRRGGIDINPYRSNKQISPGQINYRFARQ